MKHTIGLTIALVISVFLVPISPGSTVHAQPVQRQKFRTDTGTVTLGPNQVLRITVGWDLNNDGTFNDNVAVVGIGQIDYVQTSCSVGSLCKHGSPNPNPVFEKDQIPVTQVLSRDLKQMPGSSGLRGVIVSNRSDLRMVFQIINTSTGEVVAIWVPQGSPAVGKE